mmetsp:Transcript_15949/g.43921  ORF Transcript_15949/g.43921 Transcript_15949/m.43921 type:complete len:314 (+) Transcript_15949:83-1024(+)
MSQLLLPATIVVWSVITTPTSAFAPAHLFSPTGSSSSTTQLAFFNFGGDNDAKKAAVAEEEEKTEEKPAEPEEDKDPVEKIFEFFFGKPEEEPFGLKRFGSERFPEQYPATVDEWAEPLEGDDKDVAYLRPLLKGTNFEFRNLQLTYDANRNGWDAYKFHQAVDRQGAALVVCTTSDGLKCGGYNPKGWVGYGEARGSIAAFLWREDKGLFGVGGSESGFVKLRKVGGAGLAQLDNPENGPSFGADSLIIPLGKSDPKMARSKLGSYYERFPDGSNSLFGKPQVQLRDLKVYHGVYEEGEYIPFTDAEPFALY